ncbi:MAG: patatin-like phospholipase family protein [Clostridium sp.]
MKSLILEGGTFRPIFSAGIMDALLDNDIMPDYCIGVSAGITNAFSYLSRQNKRNLEILESFRNDKRYLGARNFLKCKSLFGLDFVFDTIPNKLNKFDEKAFSEYKGKVLVGVTNALTGKSEYLDGHKLDPKCTMLRATCAIPLVFPAIYINGTPYFDGGLADPIPIKKAIKDGSTKHLIILTRPESYRKTLSKSTKVAGKILKKKYPKLVPLFLNRHNTYNETVRFCEELEKEGKAIILRPTEETQVESFEKDVEKLRLAYNNGYKLALSRMDAIKNLYN